MPSFERAGIDGQSAWSVEVYVRMTTNIDKEKRARGRVYVYTQSVSLKWSRMHLTTQQPRANLAKLTAWASIAILCPSDWPGQVAPRNVQKRQLGAAAQPSPSSPSLLANECNAKHTQALDCSRRASAQSSEPQDYVCQNYVVKTMAHERDCLAGR